MSDPYALWSGDPNQKKNLDALFLEYLFPISEDQFHANFRDFGAKTQWKMYSHLEKTKALLKRDKNCNKSKLEKLKQSVGKLINNGQKNVHHS